MSIPSVPITGVPDPLPDGLLVLDVREDDEWAYGHVEGSLHIPMMEIPSRLHEIEGEQTTVIELKVDKSDLGKVIGKQGRTARALRTILNAASTKLRKRSVLEIIE